MYSFKCNLKKKKEPFTGLLLCSVDFSAHNGIRDVSFDLMLLVDFFLNHLCFYSDLMMKRVGTPSIGNTVLRFSTAMGIYFNLD